MSLLNSSIRLQALAETGLMDSLPEASFDRLTRIASRLLNTPVALFSLVDESRQFFKSDQGLALPLAMTRQTPLSHSFCQHVVTSGAPLVVEDATQHPVLSGNLAIRDMGVHAYLGVPVRSSDGQTLGSFCAIDTKPRSWNSDDVLVMEDLAEMVVSEMKLRQELLRREENEGRLQMLSREMSHRVRNVFSLTAGIIALSAHDDAARAFAHRVSQRLTLMAQAQDYVQVRGANTVRTLDGLLLATVANYPATRFVISPMPYAVGDNAATVFALVLHELCSCAAQYGALSTPDGVIRVEIQDDLDEILVVRWKENGGPAVAGAAPDEAIDQVLLAKVVKTYLGGDVRYSWQADGLNVSIQVKKSRLSM